MRIGILADTHNQTERTARAIDELVRAGASALVHCGDFTSPSMLSLFDGKSAFVCLGNNDFEIDEFRDAARRFRVTLYEDGGSFELGGRKLAVAHGHELSEVRRLMALAPDYLFLGHSHQHSDRREGGTRVINPGALHRVSEYTVALLDLPTGKLDYLPIAR